MAEREASRKSSATPDDFNYPSLIAPELLIAKAVEKHVRWSDRGGITRVSHSFLIDAGMRVPSFLPTQRCFELQV